MHSDPMKVQIASFRLSSPVEVSRCRCGGVRDVGQGLHERSTVIDMAHGKLMPIPPAVNRLLSPAGSNAQLNTPKNSIADRRR